MNERSIPRQLSDEVVSELEQRLKNSKMEKSQRRYLPTLAELIDRLSIVLQKAIFIGGDGRDAYILEARDIEHDIGLLMDDVKFDGREVRAILMIAIANRFIWENEGKARAGGSEQDHLLKVTHSINGVRNAAKNIIAKACGERVDLKLDCLAADLDKAFGDWNVLT